MKKRVVKKDYLLRDFVKNFLSGGLATTNQEQLINVGWIDWHCDIDTLARKTREIAAILISIINKKAINREDLCVLFHNKLLLNNTTIDAIKFYDAESGNLKMLIEIETDGSNKKFSIWNLSTTKNQHQIFESINDKELVVWLIES